MPPGKPDENCDIGANTSNAFRFRTHPAVKHEANPFCLLELLRTLESERILRPDVERYLLGNLDQVPVPELVRQVIESRLNKYKGLTNAAPSFILNT